MDLEASTGVTGRKLKEPYEGVLGNLERHYREEYIVFDPK